jgi:hypothetical protein
VVNRPQDIEDEEAMSFLGDQRAMPTRARGRQRIARFVHHDEGFSPETVAPYTH